LPQRAGDEQRWEVDARIDGKLQRSPESAVDFHDDRHAAGLIEFVLDHCHAAPPETVQKPARAVDH